MSDNKRPDADEVSLDLDAFRPTTVPVKVRGATYQLVRFLDLPLDDELEVLRIEAEADAQTDAQQIFTGLCRLVTIMVPSMPDDVIGQLTRQQILAIQHKALEPGGRPQTAGASESASSSPAPAASTGGATTS